MELKTRLESALGDLYTLDRELGGGGMSRVFLAHDRRLGRQVVVKVLAPELAAGISAERFEREIRMAASLQQANIVPVLSAGDTHGLPYYMMPFVDGESLRSRLSKTGALSITETIRVLGDVARALAYAHEHGVAHRDIKPDNVLLSGGTAMVTDFGIAKALAASQRADGTESVTFTQLGTAMGTPAYMSPEQSAADPGIDHRTDIYSFGCLAYELLAGEPPFSGRSPQRLMVAHMSEAPAPVDVRRPDTPPALADLVMRCLAKDPIARPQSASDIVRVLDSVVTGGSMAAMTSTPAVTPTTLRRALLIYVGVFITVTVLARAATIVIGLPDWAFVGALIVMALGLPVLLFTAYVHRDSAADTATPARTAGGTERIERGTMATLALKARPFLTWRRTVVGGAFALGAFSLTVGAFMLMRALGIGPAGSLLSRGSLARREPVLITDFRTHGADSTLGDVVTEAVRANLSQSTAITLVPATDVAAALQRMQRPASDRLLLPLAREMAEREGIKAIVDGEITPVGAGFVVAVRLVSADSGLQLTSFRTSVASPADLIDGIDRISRRLRGKIGESLREVRASPPLVRVTTGSLEALRRYTEGDRASREGDYQRARALFREAVAIDTAFGIAWATLANNLSFGIPAPQSQQDSALTMAYRYRDRMPEFNRQNLMIRYFMIGPGRDRAKGMAAYETLFRRDSSPYIANMLALALESRREFARAESLFAYTRQRTPDYTFPYGNIVRAQVSQGKLREAEASIALARQRHPSYLTAVILSAMLPYYLDEPDAFRHALDSLRASRTPRLRITATYALSDFELLGGRLRGAERSRAAARALDSANGLVTAAIVDSVEFAMRDAWFRGQQARAARRLDAALARLPVRTLEVVDRPYFAAARAYAIAGRPDRARAMLREYTAAADTSLRRFWEWQYRGALGEIALAEGKPRIAIDEFRRADRAPDGPADWNTISLFVNLGRAFDAANEADSAIAMFERYRDTPFYERHLVPNDPIHLAAVHKRLGELYEARGDRAKAAASYARFTELWKEADPELQPIVAEARAKLTRLRATER